MLRGSRRRATRRADEALHIATVPHANPAVTFRASQATDEHLATKATQSGTGSLESVAVAKSRTETVPPKCLPAQIVAINILSKILYKKV